MKSSRYLSRIFLFGCLLFSTLAYTQDPAQYGTPFTGVPDPRDASIYQVNMRCFSATRNFQGVINRLDSIKALGVNVIYLMPIHPVGKDSKAVNSPYCIKDLNAVGTEFGTLDDLRRLVDGAHSRGMAVMLDWVANQTSWDHPWITQHKDWYLQDGSGNIVQLGPYADVAALNFSNAEMCTAMINAMRYWVFTANIDGFRCDYADNPPISFWQQAITSLRGITTRKLLLLAEGTRSTHYSAGFDYNFGFNFYGGLRSIYQTSAAVTNIDNLNSSEYTSAGPNNQVVRYLTNHDVYGSDGSPYNFLGGKSGTLAAFAVIAYMKSVPFIYNGVEVGNTVAMPFPFTSTVINWTKDLTITPEIKKIMAFRNKSAAIRRGELSSYDNADVCAFTKVLGTDTVFVLSNLRNVTQNFTLPNGIAGAFWFDAYTNTPVSLGTTISLSAYQYKVFTNTTSPLSVNESFFSPDHSVIFPNPIVNGQMAVDIKTSAKNLTLKMYDISGREVFESLLHSALNTFDISSLKKGVYLAKFSNTLGTNTQKIVIN
ncbi:MAG: alpha-amylase family glycosyl hydrolase [Bacteroidales bacterium]|nr:alpha-amylase family glycosyl hydrolase [Bacteroidales bacterium]